MKVLFFLNFLVFFVACLALVFGIFLGHWRSPATGSASEGTFLRGWQLTSLELGLELLLHVLTLYHGALISIPVTQLLVVIV